MLGGTSLISPYPSDHRMVRSSVYPGHLLPPTRPPPFACPHLVQTVTPTCVLDVNHFQTPACFPYSGLVLRTYRFRRAFGIWVCWLLWFAQLVDDPNDRMTTAHPHAYTACALPDTYTHTATPGAAYAATYIRCPTTRVPPAHNDWRRARLRCAVAAFLPLLNAANLYRTHQVSCAARHAFPVRCRTAQRAATPLPQFWDVTSSVTTTPPHTNINVVAFPALCGRFITAVTGSTAA